MFPPFPQLVVLERFRPINRGMFTINSCLSESRVLTFLKACSMIICLSVFGIRGKRSLSAASACALYSSWLSGIGSGSPEFEAVEASSSPIWARASSTMVRLIWWPLRLI